MSNLEESSPQSPTELVEGCKNEHNLSCERCLSVILLPEKSIFSKNEFYLPHMKKKSEASAPGDGEDLTDFWLVDDMFTFENVGFSNTVENIKYLICADCEIGPIGFHDTRNPKAFYVAHSRVKCES